jgi:hypothetical protein
MQLLHQPAKRALAVGAAYRLKVGVQAWKVLFQVAVVGEHPVAAPEFAHKRVGVFKNDRSHSGLAHVSNDIFAL